MELSMWTEKYRPRAFSEVRGQKEIVSRVKSFVEKKNMPHLMFAGPAGVGKTSLALVIAHELYGDSWRENFLDLNASDERGIDVIRNKVKDFARTRSLGDIPWKIVYLDEADALTKEAQQALRRTMESYTQTCRFILGANFSSKIIEPIQSRCAVFRFRPLEKEDIVKILDHIAKEEGLKIDPAAKEALITVSEGDVRKLENLLQASATTEHHIKEETIYAIASAARPADIQKILKLAFENKFVEARNALLDTMLKDGLSGLDVIKQFQKELWNLDIPGRKKLGLIAQCGEAEFRMTEGSDEFLQLEAFLAQIALAGSQ